MPTITYRQVFGVDLGSEVQETHGVVYTPCTAVTSLKKQLLKTTFFSQKPDKVGGMGPLFVQIGQVLNHEFNRHHAGLAVDIMLKPGSNEVALGHNLVLLFNRLGSPMNWLSIIYQDVTINLNNNGSRSASLWRNGGHDDHIHIDWHRAGNVMWQDISQVPLRRRSGEVVMMKPKSNTRIATSIGWTQESGTNFENDPTLAQGLTDVLNSYAAGQLKQIDLKRELGV